MITGERGMGRSAVLTEILRDTGSKRDEIVHIEPAGNNPGAAVRGFLSTMGVVRPATPDLGSALASALADRAAGRRIIVAVDDAHLADQASLLALRDLTRRRTATLVVTRAAAAEPVRGPDPSDCLCYERGMLPLRLSALDVDEIGRILADVSGGWPHPATKQAFHTATGGNPALLRDLVAGQLLDGAAWHDTGWRLGEPPVAVGCQGVANPRLVDATEQAWQQLTLDRVEELCRLAQWCGIGGRVAAIQATTLLLRGRPTAALRVLDSVPDRPSLVLVRAVVLALGCCRPGVAGDLLLAAARDEPALRHRALACRAWLLAVTGNPVELPDGVDRTDRQAALYWRAAQAALALKAGQAPEAVCHLRRAIATADVCRVDLPWMPPFLTGCLIDALLLAGRINEATEAASEFHAGKPCCGWDVAVTIAALASRSTPPGATTEGDTNSVTRNEPGITAIPLQANRTGP
ncbi:MAG TPA: ATP-binding protein [Pseudonocardiaceae bacterium]|nr:ATP-binding protein [Pseudonocardiaceae bacterium]